MHYEHISNSIVTDALFIYIFTTEISQSIYVHESEWSELVAIHPFALIVYDNWEKWLSSNAEFAAHVQTPIHGNNVGVVRPTGNWLRNTFSVSEMKYPTQILLLPVEYYISRVVLFTHWRQQAHTLMRTYIEGPRHYSRPHFVCMSLCAYGCVYFRVVPSPESIHWWWTPSTRARLRLICSRADMHSLPVSRMDGEHETSRYAYRIIYSDNCTST